MCIVFRVVGSFLILDCHQSIGYPMERVHGWPWIPWCNTIRKVPMHGGCWLGAPWKWTDCSGFWGLDSATRVCFIGFFGWSIGVFFLNERTWWFFWGMGWSGLPIDFQILVSWTPPRSEKSIFDQGKFQVHWLLMPSSMATEVNINTPSWTVPCVTFEQLFSSLNMSMFPSEESLGTGETTWRFAVPIPGEG